MPRVWVLKRDRIERIDYVEKRHEYYFQAAVDLVLASGKLVNVRNCDCYETLDAAKRAHEHRLLDRIEKCVEAARKAQDELSSMWAGDGLPVNVIE